MYTYAVSLKTSTITFQRKKIKFTVKGVTQDIEFVIIPEGANILDYLINDVENISEPSMCSLIYINSIVELEEETINTAINYIESYLTIVTKPIKEIEDKFQCIKKFPSIIAALESFQALQVHFNYIAYPDLVFKNQGQINDHTITVNYKTIDSAIICHAIVEKDVVHVGYLPYMLSAPTVFRLTDNWKRVNDHYAFKILENNLILHFITKDTIYKNGKDKFPQLNENFLVENLTADDYTLVWSELSMLPAITKQTTQTCIAALNDSSILFVGNIIGNDIFNSFIEYLK